MASGFLRNEKNGVVYYTSELLGREEGLLHAFSTRLGGVSEGAYSSLNLGFSTGDSKDRLLENYRRVTRAAGFCMEELVLARQIHGDDVVRVTKKDCGAGIFSPQRFEGADALITNEPGVALVTFHADCVPVLLYEKKARVLSLVHAGWRGTVKKIAAKAAGRMAEEFGADPGEIKAAVGPSIHPCCYEVGEDVARAAKEVFPDANDVILERGGRICCDLQRANVLSLLLAGVREENISLSRLCTKCNPREFYSHRASPGRRGSLGVFAKLV